MCFYLHIFFKNYNVFENLNCFGRSNFKKIKNWNFRKLNWFLKIEICNQKYRMTPSLKFEVIWKSQWHYHIMLTLSQIKFQYMKNTLHVADFHSNRVLLTRNMFKQAQVINKLGWFGTGFPLAPVCCAGGKSSTRFPPGTRRAESTFSVLYLNSFKYMNSHKSL